jgi:hypothetical protein
MGKQQFVNVFDKDDQLRELKSEALFNYIVFLVESRKITTHVEMRLALKYLKEAESVHDIYQLPAVVRERFLVHKSFDRRGKAIYVSRIGLRSKIKIKAAPGFKTMRMLRLVCTKKFVDRELGQIHSDAIFELYEAEKAGDKKLARLIPWRLRIHLLSATASGLAGWFFSKVSFKIGSIDQ